MLRDTRGCACSEKLNRCAKIELYPQKAFHVNLFIFWTISVRLNRAIRILCSWEPVSFTELMPKNKNYLKLKMISRNSKGQKMSELCLLFREEENRA